MTQTLNYSKVKADADGSIAPVGTILPWSKAIAPNGFLKCDGTAISRTTFRDLFAVIGTTYGSGDGSTTFNLPNLTSRVPIQANSSTNVGQTGGAHDTTGAGFTLNNNLSAQNTQNLAAQSSDNFSLTGNVTNNLAAQNTQNLSLQTASNLAIQDSQNLAVSIAQNLAGNITGNVSAHTLSLAQITSHNHPGKSSFNAASQNRNGPAGSFVSRQNGGSIAGNSGGNQSHTHNHNLSGAINGSVGSSVTGTVTAAVAGSVTGNVSGTADATLAGNVALAKTGDIATSLSGNVGANLSGNVTIQNASLFSPHVVTIYIIKH